MADISNANAYRKVAEDLRRRAQRVAANGARMEFLLLAEKYDRLAAEAEHWASQPPIDTASAPAP
jgi:hypothetical protein